MMSLMLPQFNLSPPLGMIQELCEKRSRVLSMYQTMLECQKTIDIEDGFPTLLQCGYGYGASIDRAMARLEKDVDARLWIEAINHCQFGVLMNQDDLSNLLDTVKDNPVPFTRDTATATLLSRFELAEETFVKGLVSLFKTLDRSYKTNKGWDINKKLIIGQHKRGRLNDLQRILMLLDGGDPRSMDYDELLVEQINKSAYKGVMTGETEHLTWRLYMNANVHVSISRPDLLVEANSIIADHYGATLGAA